MVEENSSFTEEAIDVVPADISLDKVIAIDRLRNGLETLHFVGETILAIFEDFVDKLAACLLVVRIAKVLLDTLSKSIDAAAKFFGIMSRDEFFEALERESRFRR
jgi:hypothetical protein